jgi:hypothetical protein
MDHRKPLSFLVAANHLRRDGSVKLAVPFVADIEPGGMPVRITEVRSQTADWTSLLDERKTGSINLANVLVDPADIEWRSRSEPAESLSVSDRGSDPTAASALEHPRVQTSGFTPSIVVAKEEPAQPKEESMSSARITAKTCTECGSAKPIDQFPKTGRNSRRCYGCAATAAPLSKGAAKSQKQRDRAREAQPIAPRKGKAPGSPAETVAVSASSVGLLAQVRTLRKERDDARDELAAHLADLQEVLAGA